MATAIMGTLIFGFPALAEDNDSPALAAAMKNVPTTLEKGLQASEQAGKPISAKFEVEDGKLQLSIYTMKPGEFTEVIVAPESGSVKSAEKITDTDDLKAATSQKAAMDKTSSSLAAVTGQTAQEAAGSRAVSIFPELRDGHPVAVITLLRDNKFTKLLKKLD
jgi:ribosomal protein L5